MTWRVGDVVIGTNTGTEYQILKIDKQDEFDIIWSNIGIKGAIKGRNSSGTSYTDTCISKKANFRFLRAGIISRISHLRF